MSKLALLGGKPVIAKPLPPYPSMGKAEEEAVREVVRSGVLSGFYGSPGPEFMGGPKVKTLEAAWAKRYGVGHAVTVNSATSGLVAAMGAIGLGPGDEVILPPWTMSATAMAPLAYGGIPVFADVEDQTFCIDPESVIANITLKTRAILAVNLFGHPAALKRLRKLADDRGLYLIEDSAQAPFASEDGRRAGTVGHIGVYSLNFHKHIHSGEGGVCVTDDAKLADRLRMIRNHGENSAAEMAKGDLTNLVGFNLRMTELSAAVALVQLANIDAHVARREKLAKALSDGTRDLAGWTVPAERHGCRHNYYAWLVRFDADVVGVSRELFSKALAAEGFPHFIGYVAPLYRLPVFRQRKAIGRDGFPFTLSDRTYEDGLCPVSERLHEREAVLFEPCAFDADDALADKFVAAIRKVHENRKQLNAAGKA
ncbi:MAG: DegT/DnrJ/EryC1/StrS family aminotransferase [Rhodospirillales bacterium]|nr:DegT/DnrJ/EryC1/StrS family aminotransferase [Rhodospirillales bacterium]